ncbi:MAG: hypothetical protein M3020_28245, partial [Myxococcota bacterium]|nr:hypothetical protein [Myxococcota bacterium]
MSATRLTRALWRGATLRRIRTLGAACWVAGCANLIGLDDYTESDEPVRPANGGNPGAAGATEAGAPGGSDEGTG